MLWFYISILVLLIALQLYVYISFKKRSNKMDEALKDASIELASYARLKQIQERKEKSKTVIDTVGTWKK